MFRSRRCDDRSIRYAKDPKFVSVSKNVLQFFEEKVKNHSWWVVDVPDVTVDRVIDEFVSVL